MATARHVAAYRKWKRRFRAARRGGTVRPTPRRRLPFMATTTEDLQTTTQVVSLTLEAHKIVQDAIAQEPEPASLALWLEVRGVQEGSFIYDLYFQAVSDADEGDARHAQDELDVIIPSESIESACGLGSNGPRRTAAVSSWSTRTRRRRRKSARRPARKSWPRASPARWLCGWSPCSSRRSTPHRQSRRPGRTWSLQ